MSINLNSIFQTISDDKKDTKNKLSNIASNTLGYSNINYVEKKRSLFCTKCSKLTTILGGTTITPPFICDQCKEEEQSKKSDIFFEPFLTTEDILFTNCEKCKNQCELIFDAMNNEYTYNCDKCSKPSSTSTSKKNH